MTTQVRQSENIVLDDAVLVERCQKGDASAMHRLIVRYQDRIYNVIHKICQNRDDAAELTQETFVKFIENITSFRGQSAFYTWLFRIAVNLTYNHCRRRVRLPMQSIQAPVRAEATERLEAYLAGRSQEDPAQLAQHREIGQIILRAMGALPDDQRIVLVLRDMEGMTYAEIAEALDVELGTVKSRLSRARTALRERLEGVV